MSQSTTRSRRALATLAITGSLLLGAGCAREQPTPAVDPAAAGDDTSHVIDTSGSVLGDKDITLSVSGHPKAAVTAKGDLVIDGTPIDLTPEQRALLLAYRGEVDSIARKGIDIGKQGAAFGMRTATTAITGALFGDNAEAQAKIEAEAARFKQQALAICDNVAALQQSQARLSNAVPAFAPYADMDMSDVDECRSGGSDMRNDAASGAEPAIDDRDSTQAAAEADAAADPTTAQ